MDLFEHRAAERLAQEQPLAARMRPRTLDEYVGQDHILAEGRLLRRAIQADQLSSLIFFGPPGTGKTTLASVIANATRSNFKTLNAVLTGVADLRKVINEAQQSWLMDQKRTILFVDEVHRWNKSQQDALLPWVENGTVILVGATTENPYFSVNKALLSRSRVFQLKPLTDEDLRRVVELVLKDARGYGHLQVKIEPEAREHLVKVANGDARALLNALELAVETTEADDDEVRFITLAVAEESIQQKAVLYDREGDYHFDVISAFIKSIRGSDPDAALYWLARMVQAGEDPRYIFRRLLISASEDIGLADPQALGVVKAAAETFDRVGMPEGNFHMAQATLYLATAPKSNSTLAFFDALKVVREERDQEIPNHLRDGNRDKEGFGHGAGYQYPHAYRDHWVAQQYLPTSLQGRVFYNPSRQGYEETVADDVARRREEQMAAMNEGRFAAAPPEILTFSPKDQQFERWLQRTLSGGGERLRQIREAVFDRLRLQRHSRCLILGDDSGLFTWEALRQVPEGQVRTVLDNPQSASRLREQSRAFHDDKSVALRLPELFTTDQLAAVLPKAADFLIWREVSSHQEEPVVHFLKRMLDHDGQWILVQPDLLRTTRLFTKLVLDPDTAALAIQAEEMLYQRQQQQSGLYTPGELQALLAGEWENVTKREVPVSYGLPVSDHLLNFWFDENRDSSLGLALKQLGGEQLVHTVRRAVVEQWLNREICLEAVTVIFNGNLV